ACSRAYRQSRFLDRDLDLLRWDQLFGAYVLDDILIRQLVGDLVQPFGQPGQGEHLIATTAGLRRSVPEHDVPLTHLVGRRTRGWAEREHVQRRAARQKGVEHL